MKTVLLKSLLSWLSVTFWLCLCLGLFQQNRTLAGMVLIAGLLVAGVILQRTGGGQSAGVFWGMQALFVILFSVLFLGRSDGWLQMVYYQGILLLLTGAGWGCGMWIERLDRRRQVMVGRSEESPHR